MADIIRFHDGWSIRELCEYGQSTSTELAYLRASDGWTREQVTIVSELLEEDSGLNHKLSYDEGYQEGKGESHRIVGGCEDDECCCYLSGKEEMGAEVQDAREDGYSKGYEAGFADAKKALQGGQP